MVSMEENKIIRAPQYLYARERYERAMAYHTVSLATKLFQEYQWSICVHPKKKKTTKKGKNERNRSEKEKESKEMKQKTSMRAGRRPSPGGTKLLFAGTISPMICPVDGSTEGRHEKKQTDGLLGVDDALIVTFCFDNFALCVPAMKKNDKISFPSVGVHRGCMHESCFFRHLTFFFFEPRQGVTKTK